MSDGQDRDAISNAIDRYFRGLASGDESDIPYSSDVMFQGALD